MPSFSSTFIFTELAPMSIPIAISATITCLCSSPKYSNLHTLSFNKTVLCSPCPPGLLYVLFPFHGQHDKA